MLYYFKLQEKIITAQAPTEMTASPRPSGQSKCWHRAILQNTNHHHISKFPIIYIFWSCLLIWFCCPKDSCKMSQQLIKNLHMFCCLNDVCKKSWCLLKSLVLLPRRQMQKVEHLDKNIQLCWPKVGKKTSWLFIKNARFCWLSAATCPDFLLTVFVFDGCKNSQHFLKDCCKNVSCFNKIYYFVEPTWLQNVLKLLVAFAVERWSLALHPIHTVEMFML